MPAPVVCPLEHDWEHRGVIIGSTTLPLSDDGNGSIHNFSRGRFNMPLIPEVPDHTLPCQRPPADKRLPLILLPRGCSTAALHNPTSPIVWPKDRTFIMSSSHSRDTDTLVRRTLSDMTAPILQPYDQESRHDWLLGLTDEYCPARCQKLIRKQSFLGG
jgi:hypothetical protein